MLYSSICRIGSWVPKRLSNLLTGYWIWEQNIWTKQSDFRFNALNHLSLSVTLLFWDNGMWCESSRCSEAIQIDFKKWKHTFLCLNGHRFLSFCDLFSYYLTHHTQTSESSFIEKKKQDTWVRLSEVWSLLLVFPFIYSSHETWDHLLPPWCKPQFTCMQAVWYENCCSLLYNYLTWIQLNRNMFIRLWCQFTWNWKTSQC